MKTVERCSNCYYYQKITSRSGICNLSYLQVFNHKAQDYRTRHTNVMKTDSCDHYESKEKEETMNKDIQQKLFNYFQQEHGIMLFDGDFNEIEYILKLESCQFVLTNEEIRKEAEKYDIKRYGLNSVLNFIEGAKFARDRIQTISKKP